MTRLIDCRYIGIDRETALAIQAAGKKLIRQNDYENGVKLLTLHLLWRKAAETQRLEFDEIEPGSYRVGPVEPLRLIEGGAA